MSSGRTEVQTYALLWGGIFVKVIFTRYKSSSFYQLWYQGGHDWALPQLEARPSTFSPCLEGKNGNNFKKEKTKQNNVYYSFNMTNIK